MPRTAAEGISHFWLFRPRSPAVAQEHPPSVVSGPQRLAARLAERNRREEGGRKEALARIWLQLHSPAPWEMVRGVPCTALGTSHPADVIWSRRGSWYPAADASAEPSMHVPRVPAGCEHPWVPPEEVPGAGSGITPTPAFLFHVPALAVFLPRVLLKQQVCFLSAPHSCFKAKAGDFVTRTCPERGAMGLLPAGPKTP